MADETTTTTTPAAEPSSDEQMMSFIEKQVAPATEEGGTEQQQTEEVAETPAEDAKPDETTTTEAQAKIEVSPEQLADSAYWGSLDKDGWARMERDYPVETKHIKAAQAAATRIVNDARKAAPPPEPKQDASKPTQNEISDEMRAALDLADSLDENERRKGIAEVARITAREEREREKQAEVEATERGQSILTKAYAIAETEVKDLASIPDDDLNQAVLKSPRLKQRLAIANRLDNDEECIAMVSDVMIDAARIVLEGRKAAADAEATKAAEKKKAESQARVRSNQNSASATVVENAGKTARAGEKSLATHGLAHIEGIIASKTA